MDIAEVLDRNLYRIQNPSRYIGGEWNAIHRDWDSVATRVVVAFPDTYEIGMSHLGLKIIYHLLNGEDDILCERTYAPWVDMEELMREEGIPLFSLESKRPVSDFDIFGFTLQYEMSYTNIINMLDLAGLPIYSRDRIDNNQKKNEYPLVIAGGSTVFNPEPIAPFIDIFYIGEAETGIIELTRKYRKLKERISDKKEILLELSKLSGVYVPCFYEVNYNDRGEIISISPNRPGVKTTIKRQIVADLDNSFYPVNFIVPNRDIVHDRAVVEIARGCTRGCRFCAAGISYRPVRERSREKIIELADKILAATGYEELSLSSLSTVDHSQISELVPELARRYADKNINIALPSLRVDRFSVELAKEVQLVRKSGLTFAPEAGTQRLRNVINKGVNERDLYEAVRGAFEEGWSTIKLYFMLGLPTETFEDLAGIERLVKKVLKIGRKIRKESSKKMRGIKIHVSVSTFVPKPFTPFQWVGMDNREEIEEKQQFLMDRIRGRGLNLNWNEPDLSLLEGVFSRGDRRLAAVLETAWKKGCRFEGWNDTFSPELWQQAFAENNIEMEEYLFPRTLDQILPWDHINMGISKEFLEREYRRAMEEKVTEDCRRQGCSGCNICDELGVKQVLTGGDVNDNQG